MSFEATRQIIESRVFAASTNYISTTGDTLQSIADDHGLTLGQVQDFNPDFANFSNVLVIDATNNGIGIFNFTTITGFTAGTILPTNTAVVSLRFRNDVSAATEDTIVVGGSELRIHTTESARTGSLSDKISDWVRLINAESTLGITATQSGDSMIISGKGEVTTPLSSELSIGSPNSFGMSTSNSLASGISIRLGGGLSFPIFLESRTFTQPTGDDAIWGVLFINDATVVGREFGNPRNGVLRSGTVRIALYAPRNRGTKRIRDMAGEFDLLLSYTAGDSDTGNGGTLLIKAGSLTRVSDDEDGSLSYNLDYIYDYYLSN